MSESDGVSGNDRGGIHREAAKAFVRRVERDTFALSGLYLFGSTARGDATGLSSDVDFLAVVPDDSGRPALEDRLRDIAYEVMLEYGPVIEVHVLTCSEFERRREHPFVQQVLKSGQSYA